MEKKYIVLQDEDGSLRPMAFITSLDAYGEIRAESHKLDKGEKLVVVSLTVLGDYPLTK